MEIEYHPEVVRDLSSARDYYDAKSEGLGQDFVDEFERQILQIAAMPERWMVVKHIKRHPSFGLGRR